MLPGNLRVADTAFADLPDLLDLVLVLVELEVDVVLVLLLLECGGEPLGLRVRLLLRVAAELDEQPGLPAGKELRMAYESLLQLVVDEPLVECLEADRFERHDLRHVVCRRPRRVVTEQDERAVLWARDQPELGLEHEAACRLGADQSRGYVEAALRQQPIEVVAGDTAGNLREARPDPVVPTIGELAQAA